MPNPIIFIPGIEATTLVNTNSFAFDAVWDKFDSVLTSVGTPVFTYGLQTNPLYDTDAGSIISQGHIDRLPYQNAMATMQAKLGAPVYLFGYDWRLPNAENAKRLKAFVAYLTAKLNSNPTAPPVTQFDFITHSMGGLVFTCYLSLLNGDYSSLGRLVLCSCPFRGSVYALVHLVIGNAGVKGVFSASDQSRKANRTFPAIYELCPWYKGSVTFQADGSEADLTDINSWQSNVYDDIQPLFENRLGLLADFRATALFDLATLPDQVKERMVLVIGDGEDTHHAVLVKAQSPDGKVKQFFDFNQPLGDGDGTVPIESSGIYKDVITTIAVKKSIWHLSNDLSYHGLFLKDSRVQNVVTRFILGQTDTDDWWASIGGCERMA